VAWITNAASLPILAVGTWLFTQCSLTAHGGLSLACTAKVPQVDGIFVVALLASAGLVARVDGGVLVLPLMARYRSVTAQIKNPQDRLEVVGKQITDAVGARILAGGYSYGEYDISVIVDAADDVTMAAVALAIAAGGAVRAAKTTPLLNGGQWVAALKKAPAVSAQYRAAR